MPAKPRVDTAVMAIARGIRFWLPASENSAGAMVAQPRPAST